jgi:TDG/mug DNA glycosylase family protein
VSVPSAEGELGALADVVAPNLAVLFCGLNPGAAAGRTGHHFVGRGNRFWRVLHRAGFTPWEIRAADDRSLLRFGCGLTTVVARATRRADEVGQAEFLAAGESLARKIVAFAPANIAFLGKAAYGAISGQRSLDWGLQAAPMANAPVWVLPNPSGLNRGFSLERLVCHYRALAVTLPA